MKIRNLIIRMTSDELRAGRQWLRANGAENTRSEGNPILRALEAVTDGGNLTGIPIEETAPLETPETSQDGQQPESPPEPTEEMVEVPAKRTRPAVPAS